MRVPVPGDIIKIKTGEITFHLTPLTFEQRAEVNGQIQREAGQIIRNSFAMAGLAVKYALRKVEGAELANNEPLEIVVEKGKITNKSLDAVSNIPIHSKHLFNSCVTLANTGPFTELLDDDDKPIKDVQVILPGDEEKK